QAHSSKARCPNRARRIRAAGGQVVQEGAVGDGGGRGLARRGAVQPSIVLNGAADAVIQIPARGPGGGHGPVVTKHAVADGEAGAAGRAAEVVDGPARGTTDVVQGAAAHGLIVQELAPQDLRGSQVQQGAANDRKTHAPDGLVATKPVMVEGQ